MSSKEPKLQPVIREHLETEQLPSTSESDYSISESSPSESDCCSIDCSPESYPSQRSVYSDCHYLPKKVNLPPRGPRLYLSDIPQIPIEKAVEHRKSKMEPVKKRRMDKSMEVECSVGRGLNEKYIIPPMENSFQRAIEWIESFCCESATQNVDIDEFSI